MTKGVLLLQDLLPEALEAVLVLILETKEGGFVGKGAHGARRVEKGLFVIRKIFKDTEFDTPLLST